MAEAPIDVGIRLSASVERAARNLGLRSTVPSWALIREILTLHPEYGGHVGGKIIDEPGPQQTEERTVEDWLRQVAGLFGPDQVPELYGRLVILGLSRIDPTLATCENCARLVKAVEAEQRPPIETLLRQTPPDESLEETLDSMEDQSEGEATHEQRRYEVLGALRLADLAANRTTRQADSVLLLAGLLYMAASDPPSTAAGRIFRALFDAKYPGGREAGEMPLAVAPPDLLNLEDTYGIRRMDWDESGFPPPDAYTSWLGEEGEPLTTSFGEELQNLLVGARQLAARVSPDGQVRGRHLLGAMLSARIVDPLPVVQQHLSNFDPGLDPLRQLLLDHVRQAPEGEPLDVWQQVLLADVPSSAGYLTDMVDEAAPDRLGITEEVETIAYVLTSKQVHPPLSLGLFGDWGSGKSFFMGKLHDAVAAIADRHYREEKATGKPSQWCTRVVQIDFNAWHYSDANLWACLVTHIYDELDRELTDRPSDRELKEQIQKEVQLAEDVVKEAQARLDTAQARVDRAGDALQAARQSKEQAEEGVQALINDVTELLKGDTATRDKLEEATTALGYPEAAASYDALVELDADLKTFSGRLGMLSVSLLRTPWTLIVLALLVLGLPIAISLLLSAFAEQINIIWQRVAEASTFLIGLSAGLRVWIGRGTALIGAVESGLTEAQKIRKERIERDPAVEAKRKALAEAESAEKAARENLQDAQADLQRLETQLKELKPERRLLRLIEERASSAAYSQHLGIISLIRSDFDRMSKLLVEMSGEKRDLTKELPPIQRIILYIDDLDRCRPDRVVAVLEAVHLLLAFPLFVVVVGVDPRWLRHSLTEHYPATLAPTGQHVSGDGPAGPSLISTPQDYLEKIFQIPFALRPVEQVGYLNMVGDLLAPMREFEPRERQRRAVAAGETQQPAEGVEEPPVPEGGQEGDEQGADEEAPKEEEVKAQLPTLPPLTLRELSPQQLTFTSWEEADIKRLWPMFRTPRTVRRFVNIYRLLRAGLAGDAEVRRFEGTEPEPGEYQVALLLLAVMTSFPNQSSRFLYRLDTWLESEEVAAKQPEDAPLQWADLIRALGETGGENGRPPDAADDEGAEAQASQPPGSLDDDILPENQDPAWEGLIACLQQVTRNDFQRPFSRASAERWARRVARYSFSIHPNQAL